MSTDEMTLNMPKTYILMDISGSDPIAKEYLKGFGMKDTYYFEMFGTEEHEVIFPCPEKAEWGKVFATFLELGGSSSNQSIHEGSEVFAFPWGNASFDAVYRKLNKEAVT